MTFGAIFGATNAFTAPPPANQLIGNQATASYRDASGTGQLVTSNLVETRVQQVGAFTLDSVSAVTSTVVNTKTGAGANVVYASHILTNTGNGSDTFNIVITNGPTNPNLLPMQVFVDANNDGVPDNGTALCTAPAGAGATCTVPALSVAGSGGVFNFVVAYSIPSGAAAAAPYSSGTVTVTPGTPALYATGNTSAADVDNVNVSALAAFSATKSLTAPTVAGPGGSTYPVATQNGPRSLPSCTNTTHPVTTTASCTYSTYTINFQNTGGAAGAFYLNDVLPTGFTYVTGSAVWSGASGTALSESGTNPSGISFTQSGQTVNALIANVNPNVASSLSFMVQVNSTATIGTGLTRNTATYDPATATHAMGAGAGTVSTNTAAFTVISTRGVVLGSSAGTASATTSIDSTAGTPNSAFGTASDDQNVALTITASGSVKFAQKVFNTGNAADTFNMSYTNLGANPFPSGTVFSFYQADGSTPLLDTNSDGIVDTGPLAAAGTTTIVVQATIPASTPAGATPFTLTVRATSAGDSTKFDASGDQVNSVAGILVDLTNSAAGNVNSGGGTGLDFGAGPSATPTSINTTAAGTGTIFTLFIKNNDTPAGGQTYNLAASQTSGFPGSLPAGWAVRFVAAGTTCTGTAITTTSTILPAGQLQIDACVTPPASAVAGTTNIYFRATSATNASTGVIVSDTKTDAVTVTAAATFSASLTPPNNGQVSPGGTVVYAHTLNNTGTQACSTYTLAATGSAAGWTTALYLDNNNNGIIDSGDTPVGNPSAAALAAGGSQKILVRVFAPGSATAGQTGTTVVTATFTTANGGNCGAPSVNDISTVVTGVIRVQKTQSIDATCDGIADGAFSGAQITGARPGQCVVYQVIATNEGTAAVTNVTINDALPSYTTLSSTQPPGAGAQCVASTGVTGSPVYAASGTTVSCGSAVNSVPPGGTLQLSFAVKIDS